MGDQAWSLGETRHGALTVAELLKAERCCAKRNSKKGVRKQRGCFREKQATTAITLLE